MKVCLIEKDDGTGNGGLGGVCLNWGCIPSKSLLKNAELLNEMKNPDEWGFSFKEFKADISKAIDRSREVSKKLTQGIEFLVKKNKIDLVMGSAQLTSSTNVKVGENSYTAGNIILATGSKPIEISSAKFDNTNIVDSTGALEFLEVPEHSHHIIYLV